MRAVPAASRPAGGPPGLRVAVVRPADRPSAAYRRFGLAGPGDTVQSFAVTRVGDAGGPRATYRLVSNRRWLRPGASTVTLGADGAAVVDVHYDASLLGQPGRYVGAVEAVSESDSAAGAAFRLVSEIIVPESARGSAAGSDARRLAPGRTWRYYVAVPPGASGLATRLVLPDTGERASLWLYEPSGRPSRTLDHVDVGGGGGARGVLSVTGEDVSPGVWEAVVQAMPGDTLRYAFSAGVPSIAVARLDSGAAPRFSLVSMADRDTTVRVAADRIGVVTGWEATVERGGPYTRTFAAPDWATGVVVEVRLAPEVWNAVTDFGVTLFDRDGAQLGQGPMNFDFDRVTVDLPPKRGPAFPVTLELFPAFARPEPPAAFAAQVSVAFVGPALPIALGAADAPALVSVPAGGSREVVIPAFPRLAPSPEWRDVVRIRVTGGKDDWMGVERTMGISRP